MSAGTLQENFHRTFQNPLQQPMSGAASAASGLARAGNAGTLRVEPKRLGGLRRSRRTSYLGRGTGRTPHIGCTDGGARGSEQRGLRAREGQCRREGIEGVADRLRKRTVFVARDAVPEVHHEDAVPAVGHRRIEPDQVFIHIGMHVDVWVAIQSQVGIGEGREVESDDPCRARAGGVHRIIHQLETAEIGPFLASGVTGHVDGDAVGLLRNVQL